MSKLYEVPRNTWVKPIGTPKVPPEGVPVEEGENILFKHCDGMYSYCINEKGFTVHLPAWQEVSITEKPM